MIKVQMRQHDDIYLMRRHANGGQRLEQDMFRLHDAISLAESWGEEGSNAGLKQDVAGAIPHQ
jgi:hypothetical protein